MAAVLLAAVPVAAQTADDLFDPKSIQEIRLSVNSRDLGTLRAHTELNTWYTADLTWRNIRVRNAGIRSRGQGSRNPTKPGYRVDFAHYTTGQTFVGLSTIILDNIWQDDSQLRERLAFTMFDRMGQPVPRESFCRLYVNNAYQGLYAITEEIDGNFAKRVTGETDGTVFEYHWSVDGKWWAEDLGSIAAYKPKLEPRTHVLDADSTLYNPIVSLFKEVNGPDDAVGRSRVEEYIDLKQFMIHAGIEEFIAENDGILGYAGMNNFYLYRGQGTAKHRLFVWDQDYAFDTIDINTPPRATDANVIFRRAMADPELREAYFQAIEDCARIAAADGFLLDEIERLVGIIVDTVRSDPNKQFDNDRWDQAVEYLRQFAVRRPQVMLDEVARLRKGGH